MSFAPFRVSGLSSSLRDRGRSQIWRHNRQLADVFLLHDKSADVATPTSLYLRAKGACERGTNLTGIGDGILHKILGFSQRVLSTVEG